MTYHEAALILEAIVDETHALTTQACEALMMGMDALEEKARTADDGK